MKSLRLRITGLHCGGCFNRIDRIVTVNGGSQFDYDFSTMIGTMILYDDSKEPSTVAEAIEKAGYHAQILSIQEEE